MKRTISMVDILRGRIMNSSFWNDKIDLVRIQRHEMFFHVLTSQCFDGKKNTERSVQMKQFLQDLLFRRKRRIGDNHVKVRKFVGHQVEFLVADHMTTRREDLFHVFRHLIILADKRIPNDLIIQRQQVGKQHFIRIRRSVVLIILFHLRKLSFFICFVYSRLNQSLIFKGK